MKSANHSFELSIILTMFVQSIETKFDLDQT